MLLLLLIKTAHIINLSHLSHPGEKQFSFEEFLPIVKSLLKVEDIGTFAEFCEAFKSFDREGMGYITAGEMNYMLTAMGTFDIYAHCNRYV